MTILDEVVHAGLELEHAVEEAVRLPLRPRRRRELKDFETEAARRGPMNRRPLGVRPVDVSRIVGSVGRAKELGPDFRPRQKPLLGTGKSGVGRFERILKLMERGEPLPPIEVYKLGSDYYVLDGNHRVAAAIKLGQQFIDADVVEFVPVNDTAQNRLFRERRQFEQITGLRTIGCAEVGHYPRLLDLIREHRHAMSLAYGAPVSLKEAAAAWYGEVYYPISERIRATGVRRYFPEKRIADLFVALAEFRQAESERLTAIVSWDEALEQFVARAKARYSNARRRLPSLRSLLHPGLLLRRRRRTGAGAPAQGGTGADAAGGASSAQAAPTPAASLEGADASFEAALADAVPLPHHEDPSDEAAAAQEDDEEAAPPAREQSP